MTKRRRSESSSFCSTEMDGGGFSSTMHENDLLSEVVPWSLTLEEETVNLSARLC